MRELKKTVANVTNAELYAIEKRRVEGDGPNWATCVDTYLPYHSGCITGISCYVNKSDLAKAIAFDDKEFSEMGRCSFQLYMAGEYMGRYQTTYHKSGKCLEKLNN